MSRYKCKCGYVSRRAEERDIHARICGKAHSLRRVVSCRKTAPAVVRSIMFLLGVEYVANEKFEKAVNLVREKWHDGYKDGLRRSISKLKAIYAEREGS